MYGKLAVAAGFAAGYVLGSKAGRQRYEDIVAQARKVAGNETVQSTAGVLQAKGTELVDKAKQSDLASKVKSTVGREKNDAPTSGTTAYETTTTYESTPSTDLFEPTTTPVNGTNNS
ncbi:hypothetical protein [Pseudonocardia sp.]|jgi:hypothetical protein|uniref:hypothetical protein n=1 Tax=Pseudonocardia sp. TaxID=60912 RepID=UPI0031FD32A6